MSHKLSFNILIVGCCLCLISFIGTLFVMFAYFCSKRTKQNIFYYIIFHLAVIDLCFQLSALPVMLDWIKGQEPVDDRICQAAGVLRTFANLCSYLMNVFFAWTIYSCVQMSNTRDELKAKYSKMILGTYFFSSILSFLPLATNSIGMGALYCSMVINDQTGWNAFWSITVYYIPFTIAIVSIAFFIAKTISKLRSYFNQSKRTSCKFYKLLIIPTIFLLVNSGALLDRLFVLLSANSPVIIRVSHFLIRQLQGSFHGGLYAIMIFSKGSKKSSSSSSSLLESSTGNTLNMSFNSDMSTSMLLK